ncbi:MAG: multiheme c-type cytochrome [Sphingobacteriales bacterium]
MKKINIVAAICVLMCTVVYMQCKTNKPSDPRGNAYAGAVKCMKCHSDIYRSYLHTAHYMASLPATPETVHGSFNPDSNTFAFNAAQKIVMEKHGDSLFQSYYLNGKLKESHRFDIVLGAVKGESYLSWKGNGLNQLPVSYYTKQGKWILSPRFAPGYVNFNRTISSRCMECHASYIEGLADDAQRLNAAPQFDKSSLIYSVDCERCHGPGAQHVDFQTNNPGVKTAKFIASFSSLPRMRKLEVCGQCHSGNNTQMLRPIFGFRPGDTLDNYQLPGLRIAIDNSHLDVHGNQLQLLESSKCFINSRMDCSTCHDTHQNQRGNTALFIQKCLNCHSTANHNYCKIANTLNAQMIKSNCIQCHMPALPSSAIVSSTVDKTSFADILVHTHHIAIYPNEVRKILAMPDK